MNKPFSDTPRQDFGTASDVNKTPTTATPSDDEGLREEIEQLQINSPNPHQFTEDVMALISQKVIEAFKQGQRVGQYQAADKLYGHTTTLWLFKDDPTHSKAEWSERISDLVKDCEKYMNHNRKTYAEYVASLTTNQATKDNEKEDK